MFEKNNFENKGDYYIGYTNRHNNEFYFDSEYYCVVKNHYWKLNSNGDPITTINDHIISMKKMLFGDEIFIHKNGNNKDVRSDNISLQRGSKKCLSNGYILIYMPDHEKAFDNGCVYEHVLVAEKILGRHLKTQECVHHIDRNRINNQENNLIVFRTSEDHAKYHAGYEIEKQDDGTYIAIGNDVKYHYINQCKNELNKKPMVVSTYNSHICPICGGEKYVKAKMCLQCRNKKRSEHLPSKEELEKLIYNTSFEEIGRKFNVSGKAVVKWCKKYNLPSRKKDMKK